MKLAVKYYFARIAPTNDNDARKVAVALSRLGYYQPDSKTGIIPFDPDYRLFNALQRFQLDHNIFHDGAIRPGGPTEKALNEALARQEQSNARYIWRTVGDDKVRSGHAAQNGHVFSWNQNPRPGDEHNCRCWSEPLHASYQENLAFTKARMMREKSLILLNPDKHAEYEKPIDTINPVAIGPVEIAAALATGGLKYTPESIAFLNKIAKRQSQQHTETKNQPKQEPRREINITKIQLQKKLKHAKDFGVQGNPNNKTLKEYNEAIQSHITDPDTQIIEGTLHKKPVTHYFNPKTGLNVMQDASGKYQSSWKLTDKKIEHLLRNGKLGGRKSTYER